MKQSYSSTISLIISFWVQFNLIRVDLEMRTDSAVLWVNLNAGEVLDSLEGDIELQMTFLDVVSQRQQVCLDRTPQLLNVAVRISNELQDSLRSARRTSIAGSQLAGRIGLRSCREQIQEKQIVIESHVPDQLDVAVHLIDGMDVKLVEIAGDTDQARRRPLDRLRGGLAKLLQHEPFEVAAMVHQPIEIE